MPQAEAPCRRRPGRRASTLGSGRAGVGCSRCRGRQRPRDGSTWPRARARERRRPVGPAPRHVGSGATPTRCMPVSTLRWIRTAEPVRRRFRRGERPRSSLKRVTRRSSRAAARASRLGWGSESTRMGTSSPPSRRTSPSLTWATASQDAPAASTAARATGTAPWPYPSAFTTAHIAGGRDEASEGGDVGGGSAARSTVAQAAVISAPSHHAPEDVDPRHDPDQAAVFDDGQGERCARRAWWWLRPRRWPRLRSVMAGDDMTSPTFDPRAFSRSSSKPFGVATRPPRPGWRSRSGSAGGSASRSGRRWSSPRSPRGARRRPARRRHPARRGSRIAVADVVGPGTTAHR
jgi:hypothetical protein